MIGRSTWKEHDSGNKPSECLHNTATLSVGTNEHGNKLGVRCCKDGTGGTVTGGSPGHPGSCNSEKTYIEARDICRDWGGRLCTTSEMEAGKAEGTGCNFDAYLCWTSTFGCR